MSSPLSKAIEGLQSAESAVRQTAARDIYQAGLFLAADAVGAWTPDAAFAALLGDEPEITVGLAVEPNTFVRIREANGMPRLAQVPPDQDAQEFELHFAERVALDVLTTREPGESGAIARYLSKHGEGIQQVEFRSQDVDRATSILKEKFGVVPVYPATRDGADNTRINFFLVPASGGGKVLIELYEVPEGHS